MYVPEHFKETDPDRIAELITANPFGQLVTVEAGMPCVSHLPFLFERMDGTAGRLRGHMARANPQWQQLAEGGSVLVVFQGPHAYISPAWYESPGVPTWNYAAVHLRGTARIIEDDHELAALVAQQIAVHEAARAEPWTLDMPEERLIQLRTMIVGFEIHITDVQAMFKFNQNRSEADRQGVIAELGSSTDSLAQAVARIMADELTPDKLVREKLTPDGR